MSPAGTEAAAPPPSVKKELEATTTWGSRQLPPPPGLPAPPPFGAGAGLPPPRLPAPPPPGLPATAGVTTPPEGLEVTTPFHDLMLSAVVVRDDEQDSQEATYAKNTSSSSNNNNNGSQSRGDCLAKDCKQPQSQRQHRKRQRQLDRWLQRDYLSKRYNTFREVEEKEKQWKIKIAEEKKMKSSANTETGNNTAGPTADTRDDNGNDKNNDGDGDDDDPEWRGASTLEQALVSCCEIPSTAVAKANANNGAARRWSIYDVDNNDSNNVFEDSTSDNHYYDFNFYNNNNNEEDDGNFGNGGGGDTTDQNINDDDAMVVLGALRLDDNHAAILRFVRILAMQCHDLSSRVLALAILERSLQADWQDAAEQQQEKFWDDDHSNGDENNSNDDEPNGNDNGDSDYDDNDNSGTESKAKKRGAAAVTSSPTTRAASKKDEQPPAAKRARRSVTKLGEDSHRSPRRSPAGDPNTDTEGSSWAPVHPMPATSSSLLPLEATTSSAPQTPSPILPLKKDSRIQIFLSAGGLHLFNQWLADASEPSSSPKKALPSKGKRKQKNTSDRSSNPPTGACLLVLLGLLRHLWPNDRALITRTKINKRIRNMSKRIDELVQSHEDNDENKILKKRKKSSKISNESWTDPVAGGLSVVKVQTALRELKQSWEAMASMGARSRGENANSEVPTSHRKAETATTASTGNAVDDPFAVLKSKLRERLQTLKQYEDGQGGKPTWLAKAEAAAEQKEKKKEAKQQQSLNATSMANYTSKGTVMEQLIRREHEEERARNNHQELKESLKQAREERAALLQKLRTFQQKSSVDDVERKQQQHLGGTRNRIRWKDGFGAASKQRKRNLLEEVFVFVPDNKTGGEKEGEGEASHNQNKSGSGSADGKSNIVSIDDYDLL